MEESILLSSDSNPSSPPLLVEEDQDLDIPKVKLSEILGFKNFDGRSLLKTENFSISPTSNGVRNIEPIASTSKHIPLCTVSDIPQGSDHNSVPAWSPSKFESLPSTSGIAKSVEQVTSLFVHQLSDSDAGLSDFLSDSENEPISNIGGEKIQKKSLIGDFCQTESVGEPPKWSSLMEDDTDPPSSRSSSTLPPDQVLDPEVPDTLNPSISSCSTLPPNQPPDPLLVSSDSSSTLPPDGVLSNFLSTATKFGKKPSFHDISDTDDEDTVEAGSETYISREIKFSYSNEIRLCGDSEIPPSASSSTLPSLHCDKSTELIALHSEPIASTSYSISEFVSQLGSNSQPVTSTASQRLIYQKKPRSINANDVFERKRLKELKTKEKVERAALAERVRRMKPGECIKYVTVILDQNIISEYPWAPAVVEILQRSGVKHSVEVATDPCAVKWTREQTDTLIPQREKHVLFLWSTERLLTSIQFGTLGDTFSNFKKKYENNKLYLCVHGLKDYYRKFHRAKQRQNKSAEPPQRKRKSNYEITPDQLEMELIALQIKFGISHKLLNSPQDTAYFLQVITKSIAELPFKLEKEKMEMERNWYAKGDSKKCVRIDKDFNGLRQLWLQHLSQFNLSSLDIAKSIAELYPTPLSLYNAYRQCSSSKEKEQMLQEIVVKRGPGGGGRRLGPELSRKISIMFCQDDELPLG